MTCAMSNCDWPANYWYIVRFEGAGSQLGMCFGHATWAVNERLKGYGRRERKECPKVSRTYHGGEH